MAVNLNVRRYMLPFLGSAFLLACESSNTFIETKISHAPPFHFFVIYDRIGLPDSVVSDDDPVRLELVRALRAHMPELVEVRSEVEADVVLVAYDLPEDICASLPGRGTSISVIIRSTEPCNNCGYEFKAKQCKLSVEDARELAVQITDGLLLLRSRRSD